MFNPQEQEIITAGRAAGKSPIEIETAIKRYRTGWTPPETSVGKDVAIGAAKGAGQTVKSTADMIAKNSPSMIAGPMFGSIPKIRDTITGAVESFKNSLFGHIGLTDENLKADNNAQKVGKGIEIAAEVATPFVTQRLARLAPSIIKLGAETVPGKTAAVVEKAKNVISPKNTPAQAVAQIAQGPTKSLSSVAKTLQSIDTSGIKTYRDFLTRINDNIPELSRTVDDELAKDATPYTLEQLATTQATKAGKKVTVDYVSRALDDLTSLYKATGDDVAQANIQEIVTHAKTNGLTRKEVNDISRVYGQEFGTKAFSKTGDPLTSTNAQAFENNRKGLKQVARQGLGGDEAKAIDDTLSALYDTRTLVERNVEAVAKLQQRIQDRGLIEKAGYYVAKYADILTGGSIRGVVGGVLPRGAGYKTMNALDIEEALRKNLDIIEKALAQSSDKDLLAILKQADPVFKNGPKAPSR